MNYFLGRILTSLADSQSNFFYLPVTLQSVRGHSAIVFDGHY